MGSKARPEAGDTLAGRRSLLRVCSLVIRWSAVYRSPKWWYPKPAASRIRLGHDHLRDVAILSGMHLHLRGGGRHGPRSWPASAPYQYGGGSQALTWNVMGKDTSSTTRCNAVMR